MQCEFIMSPEQKFDSVESPIFQSPDAPYLMKTGEKPKVSEFLIVPEPCQRAGNTKSAKKDFDDSEITLEENPNECSDCGSSSMQQMERLDGSSIGGSQTSFFKMRKIHTDSCNSNKVLSNLGDIKQINLDLYRDSLEGSNINFLCQADKENFVYKESVSKGPKHQGDISKEKLILKSKLKQSGGIPLEIFEGLNF